MATPHPLIAVLAAERKRRGISVAALARRLGYTADAIRGWEKGRTTPDLDRFEDYADALGMRLTLTSKGTP